MSTVVRDRSPEERERLAWRCYAARVRDLVGEQYLCAERDAWAELQAALRDIRDEKPPGETLAEAA